MNMREEQKKKRKTDILIAGLDLFIKKGYTATKVNDIAEKVNMSSGLMFHYFETKEKLYEELVRIGLDGTKTFMQSEVDDPLTFFEQTINTVFEFIRGYPWTAKIFVLMAQARRSYETPESVKRMANEIDNVERSVSIIEKGQKQGVIREGNPYALANLFWCSIQGVAEQIELNPETPMPEAEWILSILKK